MPPSVTCGAGAVKNEVERTPACGMSMPWWRQNIEVQAPPATSTALVRIVPFSVTTPETRPADDLEPARRAILVDGGAEPPRAFGDRRHGKRGFGPAVGRRMDAADPVPGAARRHRLGLGRGQHVAAHLHLAGLVGPARPPVEVGLAASSHRCRPVRRKPVSAPSSSFSPLHISRRAAPAAVRAGRGSAGGTSPSCGWTARRRRSPSPPAATEWPFLARW